MILLAYIVVLTLLVPIIFCFLEEQRFLSKIEEREKKFDIPVFSVGNKINAFTIERVELAQGSVVLCMSVIRRIKIRLFKLIFGPRLGYLYLVDCAQREAILRLLEHHQTADYIINLKISHCRINNGTLEVHAYGSAVYLFPDTLGLFFTPDTKPIRNYITTKSAIIRSFLTNMLFFACIFVGISFVENRITNSIKNNLTFQDEKVFWNYLSSSNYLNNQFLPKQLHDTQLLLQNLIDVAPKTEGSLSEYNFQVHVIDSSGDKIYYLPSGNIVIEKEALRNIKSENELSYILNYALSHYIDRSHILNLDGYLVTPYATIKSLGDESMMAELIIKSYPFYRVSYSTKQNYKASVYAIDANFKKYGHVGGLNAFIKVDKELSDYISEQKIPDGKATYIEFELDTPKIITPPTDVIDQVKGSEGLQEKITEFALYSSSIMNKYQVSMSFMNSVLSPSKVGTKEEIDQQILLVKFGYENIKFYEKQVNKVVSEYNDKMTILIKNTQDTNKANVFKNLWEKETNGYINLASFYFRRDSAILNDQQGALNFLRNRVGNFSNSGGKLNFRLRNDQDSYDGIANRIKEKLNQKPQIIK